MVGIVIVSHGSLAEGLKNSAEMLFGVKENVKSVTLQPSDGPDDLRARILESINQIADEQVLLMVDLWGGTPFNQSSLILEENPSNIAIITGVNLPMLLEAYGAADYCESANELIGEIYNSGREGVMTKPENLSVCELPTKLDEDLKAAQAIPEGTVLGDGKIDIGLVRVDTRLLHGQVATAWTKHVNPDRIIVVSDNVSKDEIRKTMVKEAAPAGTVAHVIPLWKMVEIFNDPRFGTTRALLLFEKPQDVLEVIKKGVNIDEVNLGSMAHSKGKVLAGSSVSMDLEDVRTIEELLDLGVKINVRKLPGDKPENLYNMIKKTKNELS